MSEQKQPSSAVTGGPGSRRFFDVSPKVIFWEGRKGKVVSIAIVVLSVVFIGFLVWNRHEQQNLDKSTKGKLTVEQQLTVRVNNDIAKGNYDTAINSIKNSPSNSESADLLLVSAYKAKGDYADALKVYQQVITRYGSSLGIVEGAGDVAVQAGNTTDAIKYYQQTLQILDSQKTNVLSGAEKTYYENLIKQLQLGVQPQ